MKRGLLLGVMCAALLAGTAQAHTVVTTPGPYAGWIEDSRMPTPDEAIRVIEEPCPGGSSACTAPDLDQVWVDRLGLGRRGFAAPEFFLHEIGHRFDYFVMNAWARHRFKYLMKIPLNAPWQLVYSDYRIEPDEQFADMYAICSMRRPRYLVFRKVCRVMAWVGRGL